MIKYICDCCGKDAAMVSLVLVRTIIPIPAVLDDICYSNKELCPECAETYRQNAGVALVKVWEDMCHDENNFKQV